MGGLGVGGSIEGCCWRVLADQVRCIMGIMSGIPDRMAE